MTYRVQSSFTTLYWVVFTHHVVVVVIQIFFRCRGALEENMVEFNQNGQPRIFSNLNSKNMLMAVAAFLFIHDHSIHDLGTSTC